MLVVVRGLPPDLLHVVVDQRGVPAVSTSGSAIGHEPVIRGGMQVEIVLGGRGSLAVG